MNITTRKRKWDEKLNKKQTTNIKRKKQMKISNNTDIMLNHCINNDKIVK